MRKLNDAAIEKQCERIAYSKEFVRCPNQSVLLRLIVGRRSAHLSEREIAEIVFRLENFNENRNSIVRTNITRLRQKLDEYYSAHPEDTVLITIPTRTYRPECQLRKATETCRHCGGTGRVENIAFHGGN